GCRRGAAATSDDGTHTMTSDVAGWRSVRSMAPRVTASPSRPVSMSSPVTDQPACERPSAIEPPISPRPTTWARRAPSDGEVIAQLARAVQVDVVQRVARLVGVEVDEDADAPRCGACHVDLGGAQERDRA